MNKLYEERHRPNHEPYATPEWDYSDSGIRTPEQIAEAKEIASISQEIEAIGADVEAMRLDHLAVHKQNPEQN